MRKRQRKSQPAVKKSYARRFLPNFLLDFLGLFTSIFNKKSFGKKTDKMGIKWIVLDKA